MKQQSLPHLGRIHRHQPKIVLGVLEIVLRRDLISRESFSAGQNQVALIVSLRILSVSRRAGGTERLMFTGMRGSLRPRAGVKLWIWARPCRSRFRFGNLFHVVRMPQWRSRAAFIRGIVVLQHRRGNAAVRAADQLRGRGASVGLAFDPEHESPAERMHIDCILHKSPNADFKLPG
jgi:hypothetical protein